MKQLLIALAACLLAVSCIFSYNSNGNVTVLGGCTENGIDYTDIREVAPFKALIFRIPCNLYYVQADKQEVRVETTEDFAGKVLTDVDGGTLDIHLQEGTYKRLVLRIVVSSPDIESIQVKGSGNMIHEGVLRSSGDLTLRTSGSGDVRTGDIVCAGFNGKTSGSGSLRMGNISCTAFSGAISGSGALQVGNVSGTSSFTITSSGSGSVRFDSLSTEGDVSARISGSGRAVFDQVTVGGDMDLSTTGSGHIKVNGTCRNVSASTSGSGSISGDLSYEKLKQREAGSGRVNL